MSERKPVVVVTGASSGIGAAAARRIAERDFAVVLAARRAERIAALAEELERAGHEAQAVACDVARIEDVRALADRLAGRPLRALVNNAGVIGPVGPLETLDPQAWTECLTIDLAGAFYCLQALAPLLLGGGRGVVVNVSSGAAHAPFDGWSAYCSAKAGLAMLTRCAHLELGPRGLSVYGFAPGIVDTEMQETIRASGVNRVSKLPREALLPADVPAAIVAWLIEGAPADLAGTEFRGDDPAIRQRAGAA